MDNANPSRRGQRDGLIATQSRGLVHGARVDAAKEQIGFAANHEERLRLMRGEAADEIGEAAIHDVKVALTKFLATRRSRRSLRSRTNWRNRTASASVPRWTRCACSWVKFCLPTWPARMRWVAAYLGVAQGRPQGAPNTGAYCDARQRLPNKPPVVPGGMIGERLEAMIAPAWRWQGRWQGRCVKLCDGTTVSMPDTPSNQKIYPQSGEQKTRLGFPVARIGALIGLSGGPRDRIYAQRELNRVP